MSKTHTIEWGEWSLQDFVDHAEVAPSDLDIADEQIKYDAMYGLLPEKVILGTSHDTGTIDALHMELWPRNTTSPILVVGSGGGQGLRKLLSLGFDAYGCDISREAAKYYKGIEDRFWVATSHDLPFKDKTFATILCCDVLEHVKRDLLQKTFDEFRRVTRSLLILWVCCAESGGIKDMHHIIEPEEWWKMEFGKLGKFSIGLGGKPTGETKPHSGAVIELS